MPLGKAPRKLASAELFEYAVKCLGARGYSTGDLKSKLLLRAADRADVDPIIRRLKDIGYLNDQRFAENFAQARVDNDRFGPIRILSDLRARRVAGAVADSAVKRALDGRTEAELIESWIARRFPSLANGGGIQDDRSLASAYRKMRLAGFSSGAILAALKPLASRSELLEEPVEEEAPET